MFGSVQRELYWLLWLIEVFKMTLIVFSVLRDKCVACFMVSWDVNKSEQV